MVMVMMVVMMMVAAVMVVMILVTFVMRMVKKQLPDVILLVKSNQGLGLTQLLPATEKIIVTLIKTTVAID